MGLNQYCSILFPTSFFFSSSFLFKSKLISAFVQRLLAMAQGCFQKNAFTFCWTTRRLIHISIESLPYMSWRFFRLKLGLNRDLNPGSHDSEKACQLLSYRCRHLSASPFFHQGCQSDAQCFGSSTQGYTNSQRRGFH